MPTLARIAVVLLLVAGAGLVAACGRDAPTRDAGRTATLPDGTMAATSVVARSGTYAGIECADASCSHFARIRAGSRERCALGRPVPGRPTVLADHDAAGKPRTLAFVCFSRAASGAVLDFHLGSQAIVRRVLARPGWFPMTCDLSWCIDGEWSSPTEIEGRVRTPQGLSVGYRAEWIAAH